MRPDSHTFSELPQRSHRLTAKAVVLGAVVLAVVAMFFYEGRPERPDEANRVTSDDGMSMVAPRGWRHWTEKSDTGTIAESMKIEPADWVGVTPTIFAQELRAAPSLAPMKDAAWMVMPFQGTTAQYVTLKRLKFVTAQVAIERGGKWFIVGLELPGQDADPQHHFWWAFVESFQFNPRDNASATRPAAPIMGPNLPGGK